MALAALVGGALREMNLLRHLALALALGGLVFRSGWGFWLWLASALAWMPAAGWLTAMWPQPLPWGIRGLACLGGTAAIIFFHAPSKLAPPPA